MKITEISHEEYAEIMVVVGQLIKITMELGPEKLHYERPIFRAIGILLDVLDVPNPPELNNDTNAATKK